MKIPTIPQILTDPNFRELAKFLNAMNEQWEPTPKQRELGKLLYVDQKRKVFFEGGRKTAKTEFALDTCWRLGNMIKNGQGYYFGAFQKAVKEIIWSNQRLQTFGPKEYIRDIHKNEMRVTFTSGTFVKCDGADEFRGGKGFTPDFVILDEFADYPPEFWEAMSPNFIPKDTIVIIISSPPWVLDNEDGTPVLFCKIADAWKKLHESSLLSGNPNKYAYVHGTIYDNPYLDPAVIEEMRLEHIEMGLEDVWEREYLGKRVRGGGKRIVGTFDRSRHEKDHDWMLERVKKDIDVLQWVEITDPSQSAFGVLFMAVNPYTKEVYFFDEILERQEDETMEAALWPRIKAIEDELLPGDDTERFLRVCDEAAKWWIVGCANDPEIGVAYLPTEKAQNSIEFGLSLLRQVFRWDKGYVSKRCQRFMWQLENWRKTKTGKIPATHCDLIDCARYGLHAAAYYLTSEDRPVRLPSHPREQRLELIRSMEHDIARIEDSGTEMDLDYFGGVTSEEWH